MDALRYFKKITSDSIVIDNIDKYIGQEVEIIILPIEKNEINKIIASETIRVKGFFNKYVKAGLQSKEKDAWSTALKEKYGSC